MVARRVRALAIGAAAVITLCGSACSSTAPVTAPDTTAGVTKIEAPGSSPIVSSTSPSTSAAAVADPSSTSTVSTSATGSSTTVNTSGSPADVALAERARVQPGDLPGTWQQKGPDQSPNSSSTGLTCADPPADLALFNQLSTRPNAKTGRITEAGTARVLTEEIDVAPDEAFASKVFGVVLDPKFPACFVGQIETPTPGAVGASVTATVTGLDLGEPPVDSATAFVVTVTADVQGATNTSTFVLAVVRVDRIIGALTIEGDAASPTGDQVRTLLEAAAARMTSALEG
jgi:hypothetical protein